MKVVEESLHIPVADVVLEVDVVIPDRPRGVVLFAHGSGSGRHSPRGRRVAAELSDAGLATVLADLLTPAEEHRDEMRFAVGLLAARVTALTDWLAMYSRTRGLGIGYFGASTGAAASLVAAAERPGTAQAVVSRGGRPDLAGEHLQRVYQPTLLIVGGDDAGVVDLNCEALRRLPAEARLEIVPGATHLFEEPGAMERVADQARDWFLLHLRPVAHPAGQYT
ncbi:alpha/beta family hydrolase [Actinomadura sp. DC4]|uniref:dienelactone hydrolase family protein n=1 Tax=Actinomadura sp. DC4 TaxID=3055069 RepID=UPI0025B0A0EB|nr:alpha/beta family hydrolase [Actinomadura sp. DC4]MDN3359844.1 dienelactone hydrolase family protein [Actinomadura sp. DC4]